MHAHTGRADRAAGHWRAAHRRSRRQRGGRGRGHRARRGRLPGRGRDTRSSAPPPRRSARRSGRCGAQVSLALRATGLLKINHDVVVPRGRVPELFDVVEAIKRDYRLRVASFGHAGDGNIHVNLMVDPKDDGRDGARARRPNASCSSAWSRSKGRSAASTASASRRSRTSRLELSDDRDRPDEARQGRLRPAGILNPGKIFP